MNPVRMRTRAPAIGNAARCGECVIDAAPRFGFEDLKADIANVYSPVDNAKPETSEFQKLPDGMVFRACPVAWRGVHSFSKRVALPPQLGCRRAQAIRASRGYVIVCLP